MVKDWKRLLSFLPANPYVTYLLIALGVAVVAAVGLGTFYLLRPPAGPAEPSVVSPEPSPTRSPPPSPALSPPPSTVDTPAATSPSGAEAAAGQVRLVLPLVMRSEAGASIASEPSQPATPGPPTATPTPPPTDFAAVREQLQAEGKDLAHVKIGFHLGPGGNARGLGEYLQGLAAAGAPAVIKSVDAYGVCAEALRASPDHVTMFRVSGGSLELPDYGLPPDVAAEQHWARILAALPPEFDQRTWLEVMNEPDKEQADWLGRCSHRLAELALRDGYRLAAFGWSSGEPEREHWQTPGVQAFLSLAAQHPDRIAVALHEYSYSVDNIANQYPSLVGRFQTLFQVCDASGIERPTVLITEWGWESEKVPGVEQAMEDIAWASRLYAAYPQVRGAAIWYLGSGYGGVANQAQPLILPLRYYAWSEYFVIEPGQRPTDPGQFRP